MTTIPVVGEDGAVSENCFQIGGQGAAPAEQAQPIPQSPPAQSMAPKQARAAAESSAPAVLSTRQLLSQLRARLRVVEREIKTRKALEEERGQIKRLISAALTERDNVRRIRDAG